MLKRLALAALVTFGGLPALAGTDLPPPGIYMQGDRALVVSTDSDDRTGFYFTLSLGLQKGQTECEEGDTACLTVEGWAEGHDDNIFMYYDEDDPDYDAEDPIGQLMFELTGEGLQVTRNSGGLGAGTANMAQVARAGGLYAPGTP